MTNYVIEDKLNFARYIATRYEKKNKSRISPIKLQKTLYFLYAYWVKLVGSKSIQFSELNEDDHYSDRLFPNNFKAWKYGPVDRDVYDYYKVSNNQIEFDNEEEFEHFESLLETDVLGFIKELSDDLYDTNDFVLVDLSHEDSCWNDAYDSNNSFSNNPITHEAIVKDYAN